MFFLNSRKFFFQLRGLVGWSVVWISISAGAQDNSTVRVDYSRDVRPILAANCFSCHGPDLTTREAELRLDDREDAIRVREGYQVIKPGNPDESELIRRVVTEDADEHMPPADSNKVLKPNQIDILRRWIAEGAEYQAHWAFSPPQLRTVPPVDRLTFPGWDHNPIDGFVLASMQRAGLTPSRTAAPEVLVRRLFLDLIGLPPTRDELEKWADKLKQEPWGPLGCHEAHYLELVDFLLASPHYGERWARKWLDLARYADTNGYEKDRPRSIWPYRDWVIEAFNNDLPFDQFTCQQLAGDQLPAPSRAAFVATGFHRNSMLNEEGGIDPLEYRYYAMNDRVATTGTTWMGLTLACAQCHSHKYDPVSHREYYELMAIFNNTEEPDLALPSDEQKDSRARRLTEAERLARELPEHWPVPPAGNLSPAQLLEQRRLNCRHAFEAWYRDQSAAAPGWRSLRPTSMSCPTLHFSLEADDSIFVAGDITKDDLYELVIPDFPVGVTAFRLEVLPDVRLPGGGPGMAYFEGPLGDFFLGEFSVELRDSTGSQRLTFQNARQTYASNHFGNQQVSAHLALDGDPQTGWSCAGHQGERDVAVFSLDRPTEKNGELVIKLRFGRHFPCSLGRFRLSYCQFPGEVQASRLPNWVEAYWGQNLADLNESDYDKLFQEFLLQAAELKEPVQKIQALRKHDSYPTTLIFRERKDAPIRPTFRHHRGEFLQPRELVEPAVPAFLPELKPANGRVTRLDFAKWLVSPNHPLTGRVQVNRAWSALMGKGLVATEGDFGIQGEPPTHPELLDWLTQHFHQNGQSMKRLHRQIVTSATYRQSSHQSAFQRKIDPENRWYSRASRNRLEAEQIRDLVLTVSGLLNRTLFGPPVFPPQPEGATETAFGGAQWKVTTGPERYRRAIYTFSKRTAPFAMYAIFDAPNGEICLAQRERSNTPLQALTILNDPVVAEAAESLGEWLTTQHDSDSARIDEVFVRCMSRRPSNSEMEKVLGFANRQRQRFRSGELSPELFVPNLAARDQNQATGIDWTETAVWALVARAIFNLDEVINRN